MATNPNNLTPEQIESDLFHALNEPFPIRGWAFDLSLNPQPEEHKFILYGERPRTEEDRTLSEGEQPHVDEVLTSYLTVTARFKIGTELALLDKRVPTTPDGIDKQLVTIHAAPLGISVSVEASRAQHYSVETFYPDTQAFQKKVLEWAERKMRGAFGRDEEETARAVFVLAQLNAIKRNSQGKLREVLGTLGNLIVSREPDYWRIVEGILRREIKPDDAVQLGKGVIHVQPFRSEDAARTQTAVPLTDKVQ